jgi:hypothetical protein
MGRTFEMEASYEDGYNDGSAFAEYHYSMWQDAKGPPIPWPGTISGIGLFINVCLPMMKKTLRAKIASDAAEAGYDPTDLIIPPTYIKGIEDGYRTRLTELLNAFLIRRDLGF